MAAAVLAAAGCETAPVPVQPDGAVDAALGADAMPLGPCIPADRQWPIAGGAPPVGTWDVRWACVSGCATFPAPPIVSGVRLAITGTGLATWRNSAGAVVAEAQGAAEAGCWRLAGTADGCQPDFYVCANVRLESAPRVQFASWFEVTAGRRQVWEMR